MSGLDDDRREYAVQPFGRIGAYFLLDHRLYRRYRRFRIAAWAVLLPLAFSIVFWPRFYRDWLGWPDGLAFLVFLVLTLGATMQTYLIVTAGRRVAEPPPGTLEPESNGKLPTIAFWLGQIAGWFLIVLIGLTIWIDLAKSYTIPAWKGVFLSIIVYLMILQIRQRKRRRSRDDNRDRDSV